MHRKITIAVAGLAVSVAVLAAGGVASAATLKGTVVHKNKRARSFVVAEPSGRLRAVHANKSPALGRRVVVTARKLRNGTFAAQRVRVGKKSRRARIRGRVTYASARRGLFVVSARGVSLVVHKRRARARAASAAATGLPPVGSDVTVTGSLDDQGVDADTIENDGEHHNFVDLEGIVLAISADGKTLTLSADDNDDVSGGTVTVHLPDGFDASRYAVGHEVQIRASLNPDGTYTAVGSSDDEGAEAADDEAGVQGDDGDVELNTASEARQR
jgi:hypothetical protein